MSRAADRPDSIHGVVVNWNGGTMTLRCLENLRELDPGLTLVHVVDNGSEDGSVDAVAREYPEVRLHRLPENRGFAAGANVGIRAALAAGADHIWLLNNDATLDSGCAAAFVAAARAHDDGGAFGGRIYANRSTDMLWCCGVELGGSPNLCRLRGFSSRGANRFLVTEPVESLTGCGLFVPRETFDRVGLLDEGYFVYVEDADFCERVKEAGLRCIYVADAVLEHAGGASTGGGYSPARKYLTAHGDVRFLRRHGTWRLWVTFLLLDVLAWPVSLILNVMRGRGVGAWAKGRGLWHGFLGRPVDRAVVTRRSSSRT